MGYLITIADIQFPKLRTTQSYPRDRIIGNTRTASDKQHLKVWATEMQRQVYKKKLNAPMLCFIHNGRHKPRI